jgi:putative transposase
VRYQFIQKHQGQFCGAILCRVMQVSRSGYADWQKRKPSPRSVEEQQLLSCIREEYHQSKGTYGSPRLHRELLKQDIRIGQHRLVRIMRKYEITARPLRRFKVTTDSDHDLPVAPNVLDRQFHADAPDTKWTCDITYVWSKQGWLYLAVVLDLFSRRVVGWSMSENLERSLVLDALAMALAAHRLPVCSATGTGGASMPVGTIRRLCRPPGPSAV